MPRLQADQVKKIATDLLAGAGTLKDAMNEALRYWVTNAETHFYIIGTAAGPHPYPQMVRDFQSVIGMEAREQILEAEGRREAAQGQVDQDPHRRLPLPSPRCSHDWPPVPSHHSTQWKRD